MSRAVTQNYLQAHYYTTCSLVRTGDRERLWAILRLVGWTIFRQEKPENAAIVFFGFLFVMGRGVTGSEVTMPRCSFACL